MTGLDESSRIVKDATAILTQAPQLGDADQLVADLILLNDEAVPISVLAARWVADATAD